MINSVLEYVTRYPHIVAVNPPCSFMVTQGGKKKVVVLHPTEDHHLMHVKIWNIEEAVATDILPPFEARSCVPARYLMDRPDCIFGEGMMPLKYLATFPSHHLNRHSHPISQKSYAIILDNLFYSHSHRIARERFVWDSFRDCFRERLDKHIQLFGKGDNLRIQIRFHDPRIWQYWLIWEKHMLDFPTEVAPELYHWAISGASACADDPSQ